jgi:pyrroline-5-carboxylate reductase
MRVAIIGCGVMGSAFAKHFAIKHVVLLCDRDKVKCQAFAEEIGAIFQENVGDVVKQADVILLAIKPKDLPDIAKAIDDAFTENKILISILAGTPLSLLKGYFPTGSIVRCMPNLALIYGQGVIGLTENGHHSQLGMRQIVNSLLEGIGLIAWMSEDKIDALTALSGSGIGFVLVMIEAMIDGGVHLGFTAQESREFVLKTIEGAIALMRESGKHPAELKLQIASPGGTTIAGLKVMEEEGVRSGIVHALVACHEKALSMMKHL